LFSALSAVASVAASCSPGQDEALAPTATLGPGPTTTSVPLKAPPDPAVIPDDPADIDEDYVQAVVDALFAVDAKATEVFVNTRQLDEEGIKYLEAIYIDDELEQQVDAWRQTLAERIDLVQPGVLRHKVDEILSSSSDCVFAITDRDFSETSAIEAPRSRTFLGLTPKLEEDDLQNLNPTPWMLFSDSISPNGGQPENPCVDT
jgi:hypothetical protein